MNATGNLENQASSGRSSPFPSFRRSGRINQGAFLMRGVDNVRAEFSLTALVYNLRRALNILGVARLMAAVAG
ncbi:MAG: hypothetical protein WA231_00895 [Methylocella sp.]